MNSRPARTEPDEDRTIGRILTRREVLTVLGDSAGTMILAACVPQAVRSSAASASPASAAAAASTPAQAPGCVVVPALTEGPYYVDGAMERSDIRTDSTGGEARPGALLALTLAVARVDGGACAPLEGAVVDVWHCDALGEYSGVSGAGQTDTTGQSWLRGYQMTGANGVARFTTIYPGWYSGRAVHIHFKVRTNPAFDSGTVFTSQLFFDDEFSAEVFTSREPYSQKGTQDVTNDRDGIFQESGGQLTLDVAPDGDGYSATFAIGLQAG